MKNRGVRPGSWVVSAGRTDTPGSPLNAPPVPASNFIIGGGREYARDDGTTTWEALEEIVGGLEGGRSVSFSSGMAAIAAVFDLIPSGARVVIPTDCYQGVSGLAEQGQSLGRWELIRTDIEDTEGWTRACKDTDLIWLESPSNPLLAVADLKTICAAPRKPGSILAVDNTLATPINQQPLNLGADVSIQSATKFIGGHSDLLCGVATTTSTDLWHALRKQRELGGGTPGVLETFLAVRGARTMAIRLEHAQRTAAELASRLEEHPDITRTRYPGLASHRTHALAQEQLGGFGTIISFDVAGDAAAADLVCKHTKLIRHATSLGAVESTIERRAAIPGQQHLPPSMLRLSVGIELPEDLWDDLTQAIDRSVGRTP